MATPSPRVRALLDSAGWRWNAAADTGTATFVPFSFADTAADGGRLLSDTEKDAIRDALATIEAACGVRFLELDFVADATAGAVVFSAAALSGEETGATTRTGDTPSAVTSVVLDTATLDSGVEPGDWGFHAILREIGFVLGLGEPDAGTIRLPVSEDTTANSMMSSVHTVPAEGPQAYDQDALAYLFGADMGGLTYTWDGATHRLEVTGSANGECILGTTFADVLEGGDGDDTLIGQGAGAAVGGDILRGQGGNDWIVTTDIDDVAEGGDGNDVLEGPGTLSGGAGDDVLTGSGTLIGGEGADDLSGSGVLAGGDGDDVYRVALGEAPTITETAGGGNDTVYAKAATVTLGSWLEVLIYSGSATFVGTGNSQNNRIVGGLRADTLSGLGGADTLEGGDGGDSLLGGAGADSVSGQAGADVIDGGDDADTLDGGTGDDTLSGGAGTDSLLGGEGADTLDGGTGADTLDGGAGNDTYIVDQVGDSVVEADGGGSDLVRAALSWTLGDHVESLELSGTAAIDGTGNSLDNTITGNDAANSLDGGGGADRLSGGAGNDIYLVDDASDVVTEEAGGGNDTVRASLSWTLATQVENLILTGAGDLNGTGNGLDNSLTGTDGTNSLDGGTGADSLSGGAGDDVYAVDNAGDVVTEAAAGGTDTVRAALSWTLGANLENLELTGSGAWTGTGNGLDNTITGNGGANTLDGGDGDDTLIGGAGNDVYVVASTGDTINEEAADGSDTVRATLSWTLGENLEALDLTGAAAIDGTGNGLDNTITGNGAANSLDGGAGADSLSGGGGNDVYVVDNTGDTVIETAGGGTDTVRAALSWTLAAQVENLVLTGSGDVNGTGNGLDNTITGTDGANTLNGGGGADWLSGGAGHDVYVVDAVTDTVIEAASSGEDTVRSSISWTLGGHLENLTLTGSAAIDGTGNGLDNTITGNNGANTLDGGSGADTMTGGAGNDVYVVGSAGDVMVEASGEGSDTVRASLSWILGANLENLELIGSSALSATGNGLDNVLTGNGQANTLNGGGGTDTLIGAAGDDTYVVQAGDIIVEAADAGYDVVLASGSYTLPANVEALTLTDAATSAKVKGNAFANRLNGNDKANRLDGGAGADIMSGQAGNDVYVVENAGDRVREDRGGGTDTVESAVSFTLPQYVERLVLTGRSHSAGTSRQRGSVVIGNQGNNTLTGGAAVTLQGGAGHDTYVVEAASTKVVEKTSGGRDTVRTALSWTLGTGLEDLVLTGRSNTRGTGNALANRLTGSAGNNVLTGGAGSDRLTGGAGGDTFSLDAITKGADTITDFASRQKDKLLISRKALGGVAKSGKTIAASAFLAVEGGKATTTTQRLVFDTKTGRLYFDRDGSGSKAAVLIARLNVRALSHTDIVLSA